MIQKTTYKKQNKAKIVPVKLGNFLQLLTLIYRLFNETNLPEGIASKSGFIGRRRTLWQNYKTKPISFVFSPKTTIVRKTNPNQCQNRSAAARLSHRENRPISHNTIQAVRLLQRPVDGFRHSAFVQNKPNRIFHP
jgi:hypothetical protein